MKFLDTEAKKQRRLVHSSHRESVRSYLSAGDAEGVEHLCGGEAPTEAAFAAGSYPTPAVFFQVEPKMRIMREEIFGPVVCLDIARPEGAGEAVGAVVGQADCFFFSGEGATVSVFRRRIAEGGASSRAKERAAKAMQRAEGSSVSARSRCDGRRMSTIIQISPLPIT